MTQNKILQGDVLVQLKKIDNESIDTVFTSPPYWGLRDYGVNGQWGSEKDFHEYLIKLKLLMDELRRVLKNTGTVWINLGDTYAGGGGKATEQSFRRKYDIDTESNPDVPPKSRYRGTMGKSRFGIPERFYIQCIDDGWIARNHIVWAKPNPMPSSVKDRFTNSWESIFFFAKQKKYYFELDPIREKCITETKPFNLRVRDAKKGLGVKKMGDMKQAWKMSDKEDIDYNKKGERTIHEKSISSPQSNVCRPHKHRAGNPNRKQDNVPGKNAPMYKGFNARWKAKKDSCYEDYQKLFGKSRGNTGSQDRKWAKVDGQVTQSIALSHSGLYDQEGKCLNHPKGKNPGDVWRVSVKPFPQAHFATFPPDLPERILKCACPPNGVVLDPFIGSGTVGMVAKKLNLNYIGIELKLEYIKMAYERINKGK